MRLFFTCGDCNGIGPEIVVKTLSVFCKKKIHKLFFAVPKNVFEDTLKTLQIDFEYEFVKTLKQSSPKKNIVSIIDLGNAKVAFGKPTKLSGEIAFRSLQVSFSSVESNFADCIITAPISKDAFRKAGIEFPGHTELFASWTNSENVVMFFHSAKIKAALLTIHIPLKTVSFSLDKNLIRKKINIVIHTLKKDFKIENPRIALLGVNPHAGENGLLGNEEENIFSPLIDEFKEQVSGPFPADAFFGMHAYKLFDAVIGAYHDQVLIPFKMLSFSDGVNFTAGLPIVRTSPDHGTAYDIAGKGVADPSSMMHAAKLAVLICENRMKNAAEH
ncbi:MAG: 4-hydroxythreonine-4-phosphate dehydrogenase PdxA [Ignavibacteriaceae bacterium]|nr:4-hydroxythreonine-4-phosphate dehydrogenase PdxA [Ignavibacteriaceae bacterium]